MLNNRLDDWAEKYRAYIEAQFGFRKGRGTVDAIFVLFNLMQMYIEDGKKLYAFFIDFSKAFDYVVHDNLWYKLLNIGVRGKMFTIIHSMYSCVKTKVLTQGTASDLFYCSLRVRQGECLSPFLFSMFINHREESLNTVTQGITVGYLKLFLLLYADDAVIFADTPDALQNSIKQLYFYCNKWKFKLNTNKSEDYGHMQR